MPATEVCNMYDEVERRDVWFMYDQGFSFQGLLSVNVLLTTVSKNLEKLMNKAFFLQYQL